MNYLQFTFSVSSQRQEILIALLSDIGFESFEQTSSQLSAYIPKKNWHPTQEEQLKMIMQQQEIDYHQTEIPSQNWNSLWESNFQPIVINQFCAVRADFHPPITDVEHELVINPKMAFGTGHHETTRMVIEIMQAIDFREKNILDYGCGTGVLAFLASKLGADHIIAIDNDQAAYENTIENAKINHCVNVETFKGELHTLPRQKPFDIVLANINRNVILASIPALYEHIRQDGLLITSGYIKSDEERVLQKASNHQFNLVKTIYQNDWVCQLFKKKN